MYQVEVKYCKVCGKQLGIPTDLDTMERRLYLAEHDMIERKIYNDPRFHNPETVYLCKEHGYAYDKSRDKS